MPEVLSHYTLLERIGAGGMGTVYRAQDNDTGAIVALKTLHQHLAMDPEFLRRFEAEARMARSIDSENVVKVLDQGHDGATPFIVMEFVEGRTLADVIADRGALPIRETVAVSASVARGLAAANARSIVHRDISPQNVIITPDGRAKVTDFGVSRDLTSTVMTATSMLLGKPLYIGPEVITGKAKADIRSDIYALGVVIFQMLTGRVPFNAETPFAVMQLHVSEPVPSIQAERSETPLWLVHIVGRCLAKDPSQRFQRPEAVLAAIQIDDDVSLVDLVREEVVPRVANSDSIETVFARTPPATSRTQLLPADVREEATVQARPMVSPPETDRRYRRVTPGHQVQVPVPVSDSPSVENGRYEGQNSARNAEAKPLGRNCLILLVGTLSVQGVAFVLLASGWISLYHFLSASPGADMHDRALQWEAKHDYIGDVVAFVFFYSIMLTYTLFFVVLYKYLRNLVILSGARISRWQSFAGACTLLVPILNFYLPLQRIADVWLLSVPRQVRVSNRAAVFVMPGYITVWWGCLVLWWVYLITLLALSPDESPGLVLAFIGAAVSGFVLSFATVYVMSEIFFRQRDAFARNS